MSKHVSKDALASQGAARSRTLYSAVLTTCAHLSKIAVGFLFLKLVAVNLGVEGLGQLGNFMSAVLFLSLLAGGGIQNGVIKYVAEFKARPVRLTNFLAGARVYSLSICLMFLLAAIIFSTPLARFLLGAEEYSWLIIVLGLAQFGFAFSNIVSGTANGLHDTRTYAAIQIIGNFITLPVAWLLISAFGLVGAALSMIVFYLSYTLPSIFFFVKSKLRRTVRWKRVEWAQYRNLTGFTLMAIVGSISVPLVEIVVRNVLLTDVGLNAAGLWQASIKLSSAYMGFFVVFLAAYFMPMVSAQDNRKEVSRIVLKYMCLVAGIFSVGALGFYLLRGFLIPLVLSDDFSELSGFIQYQLIGDFLRIATYVIGFVVVAKAATKLYILVEVSQGVLFCSLSLLAVKDGMGLHGVFLAHVAMNTIYFVCSVVGFYFYVKRVV